MMAMWTDILAVVSHILPTQVTSEKVMALKHLHQHS